MNTVTSPADTVKVVAVNDTKSGGSGVAQSGPHGADGAVATFSPPSCVHTALMMRNTTVTAMRSMNGTRFKLASSERFFPGPLPAPRSIPPAM